MSDVSTSRWDVDDLERAASGEGMVPLRAKPVVRRTATKWLETEGIWSATIGRWAVSVAENPATAIDSEGRPKPPTWEWSAFGRVSRELPRAVRCRGFSGREAAQQDAETSLAHLG
jgi:hypothetical protein